MKKRQLSGYKRVYALLLGTYGKDWYVRASFGMALVSRTIKFVVLPIVSSQIIASLAAGNFGRARYMVLVFAANSAAIGVLSATVKYVAILGEHRVYGEMINGYFNHLLGKDLRYFNDSMTGYITTASRQFSDSTIQLLRKIRESYLSSLFSLTVPIVVIAYVDPVLGLLTLALSSIQAVYLVYASRKVSLYRSQTREIYRKVSGLISDAITNIVAIKSSAQEQVTSKVVREKNDEENEIFKTRFKIQAQLAAWRELLTVSFFFALFWVAVNRMSAGQIDVAGAVLVVTYSFTILTAIYDLSGALDEHDDYIDKIIPAFELLEEQNVINDAKKPKRLGGVKGLIECKNVGFAYREGESSIQVFGDLNLTIPPRQKVGIVGLSGAGKSTLAKLVLRFEDVQHGAICIDGVNIKDVKQAELRRNIAYVPQEPLLFHDTIAANIRLAKMDASDDEVLRAATHAHARQFIDALPGKFESVVGERGVKLSGGQKQRIAIARAVLQDAPIIILDEATSALDSESEQIIKSSFAEILKDKTAIVIAHRLSTLADMDRIVLLHAGEVVEDGNHKQLMAKNGVYAKLWQRQILRPEDLEINDSSLGLL